MMPSPIRLAGWYIGGAPLAYLIPVLVGAREVVAGGERVGVLDAADPLAVGPIPVER